MVFIKMDLTFTFKIDPKTGVVLEVSGGQTLLTDYVTTQLHQREEVYDWCYKNRVSASYEGTFIGGWDIWNIPVEEHRMWFKLRWE